MASTKNKNVEEESVEVPVPEDFAYPTNSSPEPDPLADNPYLSREKCLLCQRDRTVDDESDSEDEELKIGPHNYALSQMSLWVCAKCKATLEEEERKGMNEPSFLNEEVIEPSALKFLTDMQMTTGRRPGNEEASLKTCECEACKDRRQIEQDQDQENAKLQQCWVQLLHSIRDVYREGKRCLSENGGKLDKHKQKQHVARLCARDSHQLYQRLESHAIDYILEVKVKLLQQLTSGHSTPDQAKAFMSLLLDEYTALCASSKILSDIFKQLEKEHLQRFSLNWELHDKHLFQNVIYSDPVVQNSVPMLITQLRIGAATKEPYVEDSYPCLLHKYLKFDDEMSVVAVVWRDCQLRIDQYTDEQAAIQAKQRMLREDWEFFSAQRKMLKDQIMKNHKLPHWPTKSLGGDTPVPSTVTSSSGFEVSTTCTASSNKCPEAQFSDAIRSVLDNPEELKREPFTCPTCRTQICSCHECSINHLIGCGVLTPVDALFSNEPPGTCGAGSNPFTITPSSIGYDISVKAPSFSSTDSSSDVDSDERASDADSDGQGSDCESTNSWDENNPNINLFEEFLKDAARKPPLLRKEDDELDKISPNNLSLPSPCQCHECKKPISTNNSNNTGINGSGSSRRDQLADKPVDTVPTTNGGAKPAELHLYPHIHGSKTPIDPLRRAASELSTGGGSLATAQFKSLLQPQLYKLHNNPHHQSATNHTDKAKSRLRKDTSPFFPNSNPLQPCIKDQLKARQLPTSCLNSDPPYPFYNPLSGLKNGAATLPTNAFNAYTTGALKFPDLKNYPNTSRINTSTDGLSAASSTFNPSAFSLDSMATDVPPTSTSTSRSLKVHNWTKMAQQVQPSCLLAYPNALDSDMPHEHTDECFKHLNTQLPLPANRHASVLHSTTPTTKSGGGEPKICSRVERDLYNKLLLQSGGYTTPVTSAPASTITGSPSEKLHIRPSPKDGHTASTCTARSGKKETPTSNGSKTSATKSTGGSKPATVTNCHHAASSKVKPSSVADTGKLNHRIEKQAAHRTPTSSGHNSGETEGGGSSPLSDDEDGSCSGQSSSTSTSNQKDSKYCDCCYCEFFGHGQLSAAKQTSLPTSKNYPEIRERLRQRLKKKQKEDNPCAKGRHDLVPIEQFKKIVASDTANSRVAVVHTTNQKVATSAALTDGEPTDQKASLDCWNVEELVKYITGEVPDSTASSKVDKKQRKKQKRQAEQKARKLEAKQVTNTESKTTTSNSDVDSDCDKVTSQQQGKSRHEPSDSAPSLSRKVKGTNRSTRSESPRKSTQGEEVKVKSSTNANISKSANSPSTKSNSRSTKGAKVANGRDMGSGDGAHKHSKLNNARSPVKSDQSDRQHQRTHNNLQGSGDNDRQESARSNCRLHEKKSVGERRKAGNLIEKEKDGVSHQLAERQMNMLNAKNCQPAGKDTTSARKTSQRQQPDGQEDSHHPQRSQRLLNGKRTSHGSTPKKGKGDAVVDDVFMPRDDEEVEDLFEKELNEFKRFVLSAPPPEAKIAANVNLKDLQLTRKKGVTC